MATKEELSALNQTLLEIQMSVQIGDKEVNTSELDAIADSVLPLGSPAACESDAHTYIIQDPVESKSGIHVPYISRPYSAGIFGGLLQIPKLRHDEYLGDITSKDFYYLVYTTHSQDSGFVSPIGRSTLHDVEVEAEDNDNCGSIREYLMQDDIEVGTLRSLVTKLKDEDEARSAQAYINSLVRPADLFGNVVAKAFEVIYVEDAETVEYGDDIQVNINPHDTFEAITARHGGYELYIRSGISPSIFLPTSVIVGHTLPTLSVA